MTRGEVLQHAEHFIPEPLVEGSRLKAERIQIRVATATGDCELLGAGEESVAPAVAAVSFVDPELCDVQPLPVRVTEESAHDSTGAIPQKQGDARPRCRRRATVVEAGEAADYGANILLRWIVFDRNDQAGHVLAKLIWLRWRFGRLMNDPIDSRMELRRRPRRHAWILRYCCIIWSDIRCAPAVLSWSRTSIM
jgi:hypothetical protein